MIKERLCFPNILKEGVSMKTNRRLFALICSLLILLFLPANAYAAGTPDTASEKVIPAEDSTTTYVNEFQ